LTSICFYVVVPENIPAPPMEGIWYIEAFETTHPLGISDDLPWEGRDFGYILTGMSLYEVK